LAGDVIILFAVICLAGLLAINFLTFCFFAYDKRQAQNHGWRVPEATLLCLAMLGGSPAAKYAQKCFRHKTRKQPFGAVLNLILLLQVAAFLAGLFYMVKLATMPSDLAQGISEAPVRVESGAPRYFGPKARQRQERTSFS
jgi:uncharacterized membrane protein YsdA (DUF1294 family)